MSLYAGINLKQGGKIMTNYEMHINNDRVIVNYEMGFVRWIRKEEITMYSNISEGVFEYAAMQMYEYLYRAAEDETSEMLENINYLINDETDERIVTNEYEIKNDRNNYWITISFK
jgi:hypothetical protein